MKSYKEKHLYPERIVPKEGIAQGAYSFHIKNYEFASTYCNKKDVLDAACGVGYGTHYLSRIANKVIGIDINEEVLDYAKKYYKNDNIIYKKQDLLKHLDFDNEIFDVVCSFETIEHLKDPSIFIDEAKRVLKKEGIFILSVPFVRKTNHNPKNPYHYIEYNTEDLKIKSKPKFSHINIYYQRRKTTPLNMLLKRIDVFKLRTRISERWINLISGITRHVPSPALSTEDIIISDDIHGDNILTIAVCIK